MLLIAAFLPALLPALVLGDCWQHDFVDHGFVEVPFEIVEELKEHVDSAEERVHDRFFGCQPTSTVVYGTTLVHQTVTTPPPYSTPTAYPEAQIIGVSTVDNWGTLLTWEQQGTTTLPLPCHTAAGHHYGNHEQPEWAAFTKRLPDGDVTIHNAFVPTNTRSYQPTPTPTFSVSRDCSVVETPSVVTVTRIVDHHDVVTRVVDRHHTSTVTVQELVQPYTTTVTAFVKPTPTPYQRCSRCSESYTVEGWRYQAFQDNYSEIYVDHPFESTLTIAGVFVPTTRFHVKIDGKDFGWTSEPRGGETSACCDKDPGEKCIVGGASWGQWTLPPGFHKVAVTSNGPDRGYLTYKVAVCN